MSLTGKAIQYLQENYPGIDFLKNVILQDDGDGPYIKYWGLGSPKPTEEELNYAASTMQPKPPMPSDHNLLMLLYADKKNNTDSFTDAIDKAKGVK